MSGWSPLMRRYCCIMAVVPGRSGEGLRFSLRLPDGVKCWRSMWLAMFRHAATRCNRTGPSRAAGLLKSLNVRLGLPARPRLSRRAALDGPSLLEYDERNMPVAKAGSKKEETRERILRAAARAIRKHGYEGVGVADVMKEAGLTHGGFYAHFESRDALLAAAVEQAGGGQTRGPESNGEGDPSRPFGEAGGGALRPGGRLPFRPARRRTRGGPG